MIELVRTTRFDPDKLFANRDRLYFPFQNLGKRLADVCGVCTSVFPCPTRYRGRQKTQAFRRNRADDIASYEFQALASNRLAVDAKEVRQDAPPSTLVFVWRWFGEAQDRLRFRILSSVLEAR